MSPRRRRTAGVTGGPRAMLVVALLAAGSLRAQDPPDPSRRPLDSGQPGAPAVVDQDPDEGKEIVEVVIEPAESADTIRRLLRSRAGEPLRRVTVQEDEQALFRRLRAWVNVFLEDAPGGVRLVFVVQEDRTYDRFEFRGLNAFQEREVRSVLDLDARQKINRLAANQYAATLSERYRRRGHYFVDVRVVTDDDRSTLTFFVDEGPDVRVRDVYFLGNTSFPGWAALGLYDNVLGSANVQSGPGGRIMNGEPYSAEIVDEDLDRLRLWYRRQGYRDARVELAGVVFTEDRTKVDLTFRIVEGPRYRIVGIDLVQTPPPGRDAPLYPRDEVMARLKLLAGDYYEHAKVERDRLAIEKYYGERGHAKEGPYGRGFENALRVGEPLEIVDPDRAEIRLTFVVEEGTPKQLRAIRVRGNSDTRSRVVMRDIYQLPGERLDMTLIDRSLLTLESRHYYQDPNGFGGPRFELLPVPGQPDVVDLGVDVTEGDTGQFLWGASVGTAYGLQARFQLSKRNFDITRLPSTLNPIGWFAEIADNDAFHGAGQELNLTLSPGTELSFFDIAFSDPDIFQRHFETIGLDVNAYRRFQRYDSFRLDSLGAQVGLKRVFDRKIEVGFSVRQETDYVEDIYSNAPTVVYDAEGRTEMRGLRLFGSIGDLIYVAYPTDGFRSSVYGELIGGPFGADEDLWKAGVSHAHYFPIYIDSLDRAHVLRVKGSFDYGTGFGDSDDLFLTERFYMGGTNLRGFGQRRAGPVQFGKPVGGEARALGGLEYGFPLVSTRPQGQLRQNEVIRGVFFSDAGMLGLSLDDLGPLRLSLGLGVRINLPVLQVPIQLDVAWPIVREATDEQRQFFFSLSRY